MAGEKRAAWVKEHGLSLVTGGLFVLFMIGQTFAGWMAFNEEQQEHGRPSVQLTGYLSSGHFLEATAENWESEFLQMAGYVLFTVFLFQRGSSESKRIGEHENVDRDPRAAAANPRSPWPVRRGGWILTLYENSLSLAFLALFFTSFALHAVGGTMAHNEQALAHGQEPIAVGEFMLSADFWFESLQNWQSEFLSLVAMIVLSVYLRQRGSPESKPVDTPHDETGAD